MPQCDIFISYRHLDNELGWVNSFHSDLRIRLGELIGHRPMIWRDEKKLEGKYFADEIKDRLKEAKVFVLILSPGYVDPESDWCMRELREFFHFAQSERGVRIGNKSRIVKVVKTPIPYGQHPQEIGDVNDFMFYETDGDNGKLSFFGHTPNDPLHQKYLSKLNDVAYYIQSLFEDMKRLWADPIAEIKKTVYVAETTSDLKDDRKRIMSELRDRGYRVLPDETLPLEAPHYQEAVRKHLECASLSIHFIGRTYGPIPDEQKDHKSIIVLQNELAAERSQIAAQRVDGPGFARLIWIPELSQPRADRQQEFIKYLQTDPDAQKGAELLSRPFEELKTRIAEKLASLERPKPRPKPAQELHDPLACIYLVCDKLDFDSCPEKIRAIETYLYEKKYEVILSAPESDELSESDDKPKSDYRKAFQYNRENLVECDAALIYFGHAHPFWLRSKLWDLKKATGWGREKKMLCKAIYIDDPETTHKQSLMTWVARLLEPRYNGINTQALDMFIGLIEQAKTEPAKTGSEE